MNLTDFLNPPPFWTGRCFSWNWQKDTISIDASIGDWDRTYFQGKTHYVGLVKGEDEENGPFVFVARVAVDGDHGFDAIPMSAWRQRSCFGDRYLRPCGGFTLSSAESSAAEDDPEVAVTCHGGMYAARFAAAAG